MRHCIVRCGGFFESALNAMRTNASRAGGRTRMCSMQPTTVMQTSTRSRRGHKKTNRMTSPRCGAAAMGTCALPGDGLIPSAQVEEGGRSSRKAV
eukprot:349686-Chlamydomonas_euryale.AAC.17